MATPVMRLVERSEFPSIRDEMICARRLASKRFMLTIMLERAGNVNWCCKHRDEVCMLALWCVWALECKHASKEGACMKSNKVTGRARGGLKRAEVLSPEQRKEIASK